MSDIDRTSGDRQIIVNRTSTMRRMTEEYLFDSESDQYIRFMDPFVPPDLTDVEQSETTMVLESPWDRLDLIADRFYGDPALWWVIALRNGLDLPDNEMYPGQVLYIPAPDFVRRRIVG